MQIVSLVLFLVLSLFTYIDARVNRTIPHLMTNSSDNIMNLHMPIAFTNNGIQTFLKQVYNHPRYSQEVLAHDFSHMIQFLHYGKKIGQKRAYARSVIRLFTNKLKSTPFVNAYAFLYMLQELPSLLNDYFIIFKLADLDPAKCAVNDLLYSNFINQFESFKEDPKLFFNTLSQQIIESLNTRYQLAEDVSADELRKSVNLLIEIGLSKLVWAPQDNIETWELCKRIGSQLSVLVDTNIIADFDELNDLYISLIERYCYFLDIANEDFNVIFFEKIKHSVVSESLPMLEMEEQEAGIETKMERLMRSLVEGEAKVRGREMGLFARK